MKWLAVALALTLVPGAAFAQMSFPAGIAQLFAGSAGPPPAACYVHLTRSVHLVGHASLCGSVVAPPACSNSLDFSQACDSQYLSLVMP